MKKTTRILSILLVLVMMIGMMPVVSAVDVEEEHYLGQEMARMALSLVGKNGLELYQEQYGIDDKGFPTGNWCAVFVRLCALRLGLTDADKTVEDGALFKSNAAQASPLKMIYGGSVWYFYDTYPGHKWDGTKWAETMWDSVFYDNLGDNVESIYDSGRTKVQPQKGDLVYFKKGDSERKRQEDTYDHKAKLGGPWAHVGIIVDYNEAKKLITFVDGNNWGNGTPVDEEGYTYVKGKQVNKLTLSLKDGQLMAIVRPNYGEVYDESLRITSPVGGKAVTYDPNKGLNVNWTPVTDAEFYRVAIRDLTDNEGKGTHPDGQFLVYGQDASNCVIKELIYEAPNGDITTTQFKDGHDYRIWVGAHDGAGNLMSYSDQVEITLEIPTEDDSEKPEAPSVDLSRDIVMILDGSGSMSEEEFSKTKQAAEAYAEQVMDSSGKTRIAVMSFGSENELYKIKDSDSGFYNSLDDVKTAISNGSRDYGATYMGDALLYAQKLLSGSTTDNRIIMLMSDGEANGANDEARGYGYDGSFANLWANNALNVAKHVVEQDDIKVYTLGFGLYQGGEAELLLQHIAALNGGTYQSADKIEDLVFSFTENADDIVTSGDQILIRIACPVEVYVSHGGEALSSDPEWPSRETGFGRLIVSGDGEVKTLHLDADNEYDIEIYGTDEGTMTVTAKYPGAEKEKVIYEDVPVTPTMSAQFNTDNRENTTMYYDGDGDGEYEDEIEGEKSFDGVEEYDVTYMVEDEIYAVDTYAVGETIDPPQDPERDGYSFEGWDDLPETMPAEDITVNALWERERADNPMFDLPFIDIFSGSGSAAIEYVYRNGLFEGVSRNEFAPNMTMTRGMFVTVLGRMEGINTEAYGGSSFSDVQAGAWYAPGVAWASQNGIVRGYGDGTFGVNDEITVEQAVVILARYAEYLGIDTSSDYNLIKFSDRNFVSSWAYAQMQWAIENDIYDGKGKSLVPQNAASRQLVAELIYHFANEYID